MDAFATGDILPFTSDIEFVILPLAMDDGMQKIWREVFDQFAISYANEWWIVYERKIWEVLEYLKKSDSAPKNSAIFTPTQKSWSYQP